MERVSDEWLARRIVAFDEMRCGDSELHVSPRYAQAMLDALLELQSRRAAEREQAAPDAGPKPSFVGVDLASGTDRTEIRVIRLRKRPRWLRELLSDWERRACDLVAQGRSFDAEDLRAGAEEVRKAHDGRSRKPAKWERRMKEAQIILWPPCIAGQNQTDKWIAHIWAMGEWSADTAKAAVKAAWRAWKEARRDA